MKKLIGIDKLYHLIVGFAIYSIVVWIGLEINFATQSLDKKQVQGIAFILMAIAAFGKEFYDQYVKKSKMDELDVFATIIGFFLAFGIDELLIRHTF